jgi:hypothetical protein
MRVAKLGTDVGRGVWLAPWQGPNGEMILVAVTAQRRRLDEYVVPIGANHVDAAERLLDRLDLADPDPRSKLKVI